MAWEAIDYDPFASNEAQSGGSKGIGMPGIQPYAEPAQAQLPGGEGQRAAFDPSAYGMDYGAALHGIRQLPESQRPHAMDAWADWYVGEEYKNRGPVGYIQDKARTAAQGTVVGQWTDELNAKLGGLMGQDPEQRLAYERARDRRLRAEPGSFGVTLPYVGRVDENDLLRLGGTITEAAALPFAEPLAPTTALRVGGNVAANTAAYSALDKAGQSEGDIGDKAMAGAGGAIEGGTTGMLFGYGLGKLMGKPGLKVKTDDPNAPITSAAEAADQLGVDLPKFAAAGDGMMGQAAKGMAQTLANVPIVGAPVTKAAQKAVDQIGEASAKAASAFDPAAPNAAQAGEAASSGIIDWIEKGSKARVGEWYKRADDLINKQTTGDLSATRERVKSLLERDAASATDVGSKAASFVQEALSRPEGLTFDGMKNLRTALGRAIKDPLITQKPELESLYSTLTEDMRMLAAKAGGPEGLKAWEKANDIAAKVSGYKKQLAKIVGVSGDAAPEAVLDKIIAMATQKGTANINRLRVAQQAMGIDNWNSVASAAVGRLGRDAQTGEFSLKAFARGYRNLSEEGRSALFRDAGNIKAARDLDAIAAISDKFADLERAAHPRMTNRLISGGGELAALHFIGLQPLLATAVPGWVMAKLLATPTSGGVIKKFLESLYTVATAPARAVARGMARTSEGEDALMKSTTQLAKAVADQTGEDPRVAEMRIRFGIEQNMKRR